MAYKNMYETNDPYRSSDPYAQGDPYGNYGGVAAYNAYRQQANAYALPRGHMAGSYYRSYMATHPAKKAELAEAGAGLGMVGGLVGGLQAKAATMALGKGLLALAGVSTGPAGLIGLAGMVGISALAGSVALKSAPTISKVASEALIGSAELSTKLSSTLGEKALIPLAKSSASTIKKAGQYAIEKINAKSSKKSATSNVKNDKGMELVSKLKDKFAQGEDVKKEINTLYKSDLSKAALGELQKLNIDNHLRNSVTKSGKISMNKVMSSIEKQGKELGWNEKRLKKEFEALDKRLDEHRKNLLITSDNRLLTTNEEVNKIFLNKASQSVKTNGDQKSFEQRTKELEQKQLNSASIQRPKKDQDPLRSISKEDLKRAVAISKRVKDPLTAFVDRPATDFNKNIGKREASSEFRQMEESGKLQVEFEDQYRFYRGSLLKSMEVGEEQLSKEMKEELNNGFNNSYILNNNGLNKEKLEQDRKEDPAIEAKFAQVEAHADRLVHAGILRKDKDGNYHFTDQASKEVLYNNITKSPREVRIKNIMHKQLEQSKEPREMPGKQQVNERGR